MLSRAATSVWSAVDSIGSYLWPEQHGTSVVLLRGPPDDRFVRPERTLSFEVAWLPQNHSPFVSTHIFLYVGLRGRGKRRYDLMGDCPGKDPRVQVRRVKYTVPDDVNTNAAANEIVVLEIEWGEVLGCTRQQAIERQNGGIQHRLLHALPVAPLKNDGNVVRVSLCTPLPGVVAGGNVLVLDLVTLLQNAFQRARSLIYVYIEDENGGCHVCCIQDTVRNQRLRRGGVVYRVPEGLVGQTLEIGWASALQYTDFEDIPIFIREDGIPLGHVRVEQNVNPAKPLPKRMKRYVADYRKGSVTKAAETLMMGAQLLLASEFTRAKLLQAGHQLPEHISAANNFGKGLGVVIVRNAVRHVAELACPYVVGEVGERLGLRNPEEVADRFCNCIIKGATLGSVVPGGGPVGGAAVGVAAFAVGEAIENESLFSLF